MFSCEFCKISKNIFPYRTPPLDVFEKAFISSRIYYLSFDLVRLLNLRVKAAVVTAQKMKFSIKDFFNKCDQVRSFLRIWSHLLKKTLMENFIYCALSSLLSKNDKSSHRMCSAKKLFLKTSQISQGNTCTKIFKNIYFEEHL